MSVKTTPQLLLLLLLYVHLSTPIFGQFQFEGLNFQGQGQALLQSLSAVDISPDGKHIYATSYSQNAVNVFSRDAITGNITFIEASANGASKVEGLGGAYSTVVSPDGRHVYVAGSTDNSISSFSRNDSNGKLTIVKTYREGINGVSGLDGVYHMDFSPDGNYLYVVSIDVSTLVVFKRNVNSGELAFLEKFENGVNGISGMSFPAGVLVSPDGKSVYVAGYGDNTIATFSRSISTGLLSFQGSLTTADVPEISGPSVMGMSPNGNQLYISSSINNSLIVMERNAVTSDLSNPVVFTDGVNGVDGLSGVLSIITSSTGDYVYGLGANENAIAIFSNNNGTLTYEGKVQNGSNSVSNFEYPVYFVTSPDDKHVYAASVLSEAIVSFDINPIGTHMTYNSNLTADPNAVAGLEEAKAVIVSPDGKNVYAVGYDDDALVAFSRNDKSGLMEYMEHYKNRTNGISGLNGAIDVNISPDGKHVYVASQNDHSLVVFSRNTSTGALTFQNQYKDNTSQGGNTIDGLTGANSIAISADGKHVYVTGYYENALTLFSRDPNTNELTYLQTLKDGSNGIDGLTRVRGVCISADGKHVYAAGTIDNAISIFSRDPVTGILTYVNRVKNNLGGVLGIAGVYDVIVSPDGKFVFAAGPNSDAVVTFSRNSNTGMLSFSGQVVNGIDGVGGLDRVKQLAINPAGDRLYSSSDVEDAISVFNINSSSGLLSFETMAVNNQNTVSGLDGAFGMAVSPDGMYIYGTGDESNAVAIFSCTYLQSQDEMICEGSSITVGNNSYSETGIYVDTIVSGSCRTVITTDLTVPTKEYDLSVEMCSGGVYNFGGSLYNTSGVYEKTFTSQTTGCDSVVTLTLNVVNTFTPTTINKQICEGESYVFGANTYNTSGTYEETFSTQLGCDSTVILNLEVESNDPTVLNEFICPGEFFTYGDQNFINSGTYTINSTNPTECNDLVTLNLNIVEDNEVINAEICQGETYSLEGTEYQNTGTYLKTITTSSGCVVALTLNLTVNQPNSETINETICEGDSYDFGGETYTESGTYTSTFENITGCDSVVTLNLNVLSTSFEFSESICSGESIFVGNSEFNSTGTYVVTLQSLQGCGDSTVTLNLEVNDPSTSLTVKEICEGESVIFDNQSIFESGTYSKTLINSNGCDSIVTLELTVLSAPVTNIAATICPNEFYEFEEQLLNKSGVYTMSFSNGNGCDSTVNLELTVLDKITAKEFIIDDSGRNTGYIRVGQVSGGTSPYTFNWNTGDTGDRLSGLAAGNYTLTITDAIGCQSTFEYEVKLSNSTNTNNFEELEFDVQLLENPVLTNKAIRIITTSDQTEKLDLQLFSISGKVLRSEILQVPIGKQTYEFNAPATAGLYFIHLKDQSGRGKTLKISVQ